MPDPGALYIIRHGMRMDWSNPDWKKTAALPGDPPLDSEGESQAEGLAHKLASAGIKRIFTSPFLRCIMTAHPLAELTQISILPESGLSEHITHPYFPEKPELAYHKADPERLAAKFGRLEFRYAPISDYPESESMMEDRVTRAVRLLAEDYCIRRGESILVVSHGGPCRYMINSLLDPADGQVPPGGVEMCSLTKLVYTGSGRTGWKAEVLVEDPSADAIGTFAKGLITWVKGLGGDSFKASTHAIPPTPATQPAPRSSYQAWWPWQHEARASWHEQRSRPTHSFASPTAIQHSPHASHHPARPSSSPPAPPISARSYDATNASSRRPPYVSASSTVGRSQKALQNYGGSFNAGTAPRPIIHAPNSNRTNHSPTQPFKNSHAAWADPPPTPPPANMMYTASASALHTGSNNAYNASTTHYNASNNAYNASTSAYTTSSNGSQHVNGAAEGNVEWRSSPRRATVDMAGDDMALVNPPLGVPCRLCQRPVNPESHGGFCYLCIGSTEYADIMATDRKLSSRSATPPAAGGVDGGAAAVQVGQQGEARRPGGAVAEVEMEKHMRELQVHAEARRDAEGVEGNDGSRGACTRIEGKDKTDDGVGKMAGKLMSWLGMQAKDDADAGKARAPDKDARAGNEHQPVHSMHPRGLSVGASSLPCREHHARGQSEHVVAPSPATPWRGTSPPVASPSSLASHGRTQSSSSDDRARESDRYRDGPTPRTPSGQRVIVAVPSKFSQQSTLGSSSLAKRNDSSSPSFGNLDVAPAQPHATYTPTLHHTQRAPLFKVGATTGLSSTPRRSNFADVDGFQRERAREREAPMSRWPSHDISASLAGKRMVISAAGTEAAYAQQPQMHHVHQQEQQQHAYGVPAPPISDLQPSNSNPHYRPLPHQYHVQGPQAPYEAGAGQQRASDARYYAAHVYSNTSSRHNSPPEPQLPIYAHTPRGAQTRPPPQDPFSYGNRSLSVSYT